MSLDCFSHRATCRCPGTSRLFLLVILTLGMAGCADQSVDITGDHLARLSLGAVFVEESSQHLAQVDAWRVQVLRAGQGVIAEDGGSIGPQQQTITVELSVTLEAPCELLSIRIELSAQGEVLFRSEEVEEVCAGSDNGISPQELVWVGPVLGLSTSGLTFNLEEGGDPLAQVVTVRNDGGGTLNWQASEDRWWLDLSPTSGALGPGQSQSISVRVTDVDLTGGQYQGTVTVSDPDAEGSPGAFLVTLNYIQAPQIGLSTTSLSFTADELIDPDPKSFVITNVGGGTLEWTGSESAGWLTMNPRTGSLGPGQSQEVEVSVSPGERPGGTYQGNLSIQALGASNSPRSLAVEMTVVPRPLIGLAPGDLSFSASLGQNPQGQILTIRNDGGQTLNWAANLEGGGWFQLSAMAGSLGAGESQNLTLSIDVSNLGVGVQEGSITFSDPWALNSPQTVGVTLEVTQGPLIGLSLQQLNMVADFGQDPLSYGLVVSNAGGGLLEWQATTSQGWIQTIPASGTLGTVGGVGLAQNVSIGLNPAGLAPGTHNGTVTFSDPDAQNSPQVLGVSLIVRERTPPLISDLNVNVVAVNDPTCPNPEGPGSRFRATFRFQDANGDLPILNGTFEGEPVVVTSGFPDFNPTTATATADVEGDGYLGTAGFDLCIYFYTHNGANLWVNLRDEWGLLSNQLFQFISRPEGANSPPQGAGSERSGDGNAPGSVMVPIRGPVFDGGGV